MKGFATLALIGLLTSTVPAFCQQTIRSASIIEVRGTVEVKSGAEWRKAAAGMILNQGDIVRTNRKSFALLNVDGMGETATVEVKENSQLQMTELLENKNEKFQTTLLDLALGEVLIKARKLHSEKSRFEVKTPTSIVGVRGTTFSVAVEAEE